MAIENPLWAMPAGPEGALESVSEDLGRLVGAQAAVHQAQAELRSAVVDAFDSGVEARDLAALLGGSSSRIYQLRHGR